MTTTLSELRSGALAGARHLVLRGGLTAFPSEVFSLADTLEVLDLSGNALTALPADMTRLRKLRALFCSGNSFTVLPPALGDCAALTQIGFRGSGLREVPAESLPPALRWLTLTDNAIESLPPAIGQRPALQKLMLAGNRLQAVPESLAGAGNLELLRLSANQFETLPAWLPRLPRLAWLAWAGNPYDRSFGTQASPASVDWSALQPGALLGEGASGRVYQALWQPPGGMAARQVALKLFKGMITSDGLPEREIAASLAAGDHPHVTGGLARLAGHPTQTGGLLMSLLPGQWRALAGPPSLESCSRDIYAPALALDPAVVWRIAQGVAAGAAHLHAQGLLHGDLYAHNVLWDGSAGEAKLSDLGAASLLPTGPSRAALQRLDVLAWGLLLGELLDHCADEPSETTALRDLQRHCVQSDPALRPLFAEVLALLDEARPGLCPRRAKGPSPAGNPSL